ILSPTAKIYGLCLCGPDDQGRFLQMRHKVQVLPLEVHNGVKRVVRAALESGFTKSRKPNPVKHAYMVVAVAEVAVTVVCGLTRKGRIPERKGALVIRR